MDICNAKAELVHIQHKTQQLTVVKELVSTLDTTAPLGIVSTIKVLVRLIMCLILPS